VLPMANNTPRHCACVPAARSGQSIIYDDPLLKIQDTRYPNNKHHCPLRPNCRDHLCACLRLCPLSIAQLCRAWGVGCGVECLLACLLAGLLRCCFSTNFPHAPHIRLPSTGGHLPAPFLSPNADRMMLFVTYGGPTCRALLVTNGRLFDCTTNKEPGLRRCTITFIIGPPTVVHMINNLCGIQCLQRL
jgi:hypothetical protein